MILDSIVAHGLLLCPDLDHWEAWRLEEQSRKRVRTEMEKHVKVQDIMQPNVYCAADDMTVRDLFLALQANEITGAPVLDVNDYLVGVVSVSDIARCAAGENDPNCLDYYAKRLPSGASPIEADSIKKSKLVSDIMTPCIHKVSMNSTLEEALDIILDEDIHRLIVTHRSHVVGIVTSGDLLRAFREMLSTL